LNQQMAACPFVQIGPRSDVTRDWRLDELATAGRENLDAGHTSRYDEKEDADAAAEVRLFRELGLTGDSVLVEIGGGTGQFAVAVAPVFAKCVLRRA
jgi:hypothetical protein